METIKLALIVAAGFFVFTRYMAVTTEAALQRREKMVRSMEKYMKDEKYSDEFKSLLVVCFNLSMNRSTFLNTAWHVIKPSRESAEDLGMMSKDERKEYMRFIQRHMLPVNATLTPHWYVLALLIALPAVFIGRMFNIMTRIGTAKVRRRVEQAMLTGVHGKAVHQ